MREALLGELLSSTIYKLIFTHTHLYFLLRPHSQMMRYLSFCAGQTQSPVHWPLLMSHPISFRLASVIPTSFFIFKRHLPPASFPTPATCMKFCYFLGNSTASSPTIPCPTHSGGVFLWHTLPFVNFAETVPLTEILFLCFTVWKTSTHKTQLGCHLQVVRHDFPIWVSHLASSLPFIP